MKVFGLNVNLYIFNIKLLSVLAFEAKSGTKFDFSQITTPKNCICIPFWECDDYSDERNEKKASDIIDLVPKSPICTGYYDVCCKIKCGMAGSSVLPLILGDDDKNKADFAEFPWMLGILKGQKYKCGGTLIHPKVALTAAHCVAMTPSEYTVRAGEWHWGHTNEPYPHQNRQVKQIIINPDFTEETLANDIALLLLSEPFVFAKNVAVICLPFKRLKINHKKCIASGWGRNSFKPDSYQPVLKKVILPIVPRDECVKTLQKTVLGPQFSLHESFICAGGEPNKDTCKGDGGGPLMCPVVNEPGRYELIGIVSWGITCGLTNNPGVYVNVMEFTDWIGFEMYKLHLDILVFNR